MDSLPPTVLGERQSGHGVAGWAGMGVAKRPIGKANVAKLPGKSGHEHKDRARCASGNFALHPAGAARHANYLPMLFPVSLADPAHLRQPLPIKADRWALHAAGSSARRRRYRGVLLVPPEVAPTAARFVAVPGNSGKAIPRDLRRYRPLVARFPTVAFPRRRSAFPGNLPAGADGTARCFARAG